MQTGAGWKDEGRQRNELGACVAEKVDKRGCPVAAGPLSCSSKSLNSKTPCLQLHEKFLVLAPPPQAPAPNHTGGSWHSESGVIVCVHLHST